MATLMIVIGILLIQASAFVMGYLYNEKKNFNNIFNSEYVLEQKNLLALDSLWKKVHTNHFYLRTLKAELPEDLEPITDEELDILGVIRATFIRSVIVPVPEPECPMPSVTTVSEALRAIKDANNEFDGSCLDECDATYDERAKYQLYISRLTKVLEQLDSIAYSRGYERGRRDALEEADYPRYPKMFGPG